MDAAGREEGGSSPDGRWWGRRGRCTRTVAPGGSPGGGYVVATWWRGLTSRAAPRAEGMWGPRPGPSRGCRGSWAGVRQAAELVRRARSGE